MNRNILVRLVLAAMFTGLGVLLPVVFHAAGLAGGSVLLPMHIPVLLCGMICGYRYGGIVGVLVPFLSSVITSMPPLYPVAVFMAFELAAYAVIAGFLIKRFNVFIALIGAMLGGRLVLGVVQSIMLGFGESGFAFGAFLTSAFVTALPGIVVQLVFVPAAIILLNRARVLPLAE